MQHPDTWAYLSLLIGVIFCAGDPDIIDGIVHYQMED